MRNFPDGTVVHRGFMFGGIRILFLLILLIFLVMMIRRIVMMHRVRKAIRNGDIDKISMMGPHGRMLMMHGEFTDDQEAGIIVRALRRDGVSDDEIRDTMKEKYGYSLLKTDALLLTPMGGKAGCY